MSNCGKRSHSRRSREYNVTEESCEDSDSSDASNEDDWRARKAKEKRSHSHSDETRHRHGRRRSSYKKEHGSKRDKKVREEKKVKKKRRQKDKLETLDRGDGVPLHKTKELQAKQSCMAFISSTRITPTAISHSVDSWKMPSVLGGRASAEGVQQSSSTSDAQGTERSLVPMSKEEYERKRNTIRRVVDPETGRSRLIRGEGEVLEEIVSRDRHKEINKLATRGDGEWFLKGTGLNRQT